MLHHQNKCIFVLQCPICPLHHICRRHNSLSLSSTVKCNYIIQKQVLVIVYVGLNISEAKKKYINSTFSGLDLSRVIVPLEFMENLVISRTYILQSGGQCKGRWFSGIFSFDPHASLLWVSFLSCRVKTCFDIIVHYCSAYYVNKLNVCNEQYLLQNYLTVVTKQISMVHTTGF